MFHREWNEQINRIIPSISKKGNLNVLDLGCGDASWILSIHSSDKIKSYTGIDLAPAALDYAKSNLKVLFIPIKLMVGRMEELIKNEADKFLLIFSSFAIHHLQDEKKRELLGNIYDQLEDEGVFILIDVFRKKNQFREDYLSQYFNLMEQKWTGLDDPGKSLIVDHILHFDFPARLDDFKIWAKGFNFRIKEPIQVDEFHRMLVLTK